MSVFNPMKQRGCEALVSARVLFYRAAMRNGLLFWIVLLLAPISAHAGKGVAFEYEPLTAKQVVSQTENHTLNMHTVVKADDTVVADRRVEQVLNRTKKMHLRTWTPKEKQVLLEYIDDGSFVGVVSPNLPGGLDEQRPSPCVHSVPGGVASP